MSDSTFEPVIIGFTCNWCSYRAADLAGTSRIKYPPNVRLIRVMCSGRIEMLWTDAAVSEVSGPVLGDYRIELNAEGNALRLDLATVRGRLQINGHGEFSAGALRFNGEAAASGANGDNAGLNSLLNALGRPTGVAGKYLLDYRS